MAEKEQMEKKNITKATQDKMQAKMKSVKERI